MAKLRSRVGLIRTVTIYERIGDVLGWLSVIGVAWLVWVTRKRGKAQGAKTQGGAPSEAGKSTS